MRTLAVWGKTAAVLDWCGNVRPLTDREERRAAAFVHAEDRADYLAAHRLLRAVAIRAGVAEPVYAQLCPECGSREHGAPSVDADGAVRVSLAHTRGAVMVGVSNSPIGLDIEGRRPVDVRTIATVLGADEAVGLARQDGDAALRAWCRKEAAAKAAGRGLPTMACIATVDRRGVWQDRHEALRWREGGSDDYVWCVASPVTCDVRTVESLCQRPRAGRGALLTHGVMNGERSSAARS